ncbi:hypothetical protein [Pseudobacteriovorax antillogorgiicola]|uniref:Uncharacterized protein n=1 Tax=Pseudobacteriovorax antillogorgiicola TaxID=1513793 RepID=A0A1Y6B9C5_9BACT|nr:hypothetical protein [Pseudobacteriovorax antillogorgiicola]TCS57566.1 hypothetical protein EDD56_103306 [Pseudobacteriovorax antillogorgiicola]SME99736.1 hypothetical protein SAMN06296036_10327 [Pseudobacteriovorax antillogorgiicola]
MRKLVAFAVLDAAVALLCKDYVVELAFAEPTNVQAELVYFNAESESCEFVNSGTELPLPANQVADETICAGYNPNGEILL